MALDFKLSRKQQRALLTPANEVLYGGAAGGGKSFLMRLVAIILCSEIPNLKVYFFRRMYKELYQNHVFSPDGFLTMLKPFIDSGDVVFNKSDAVFTFYNGAQIYLCHAQHETDIENYLGAEIHVLLIDEATKFSEKMIRFIRTRVRLGGLPVPDRWKSILPKIIYGTNPGGISHTYFKKGFVSQGAGHVFQAPTSDGGMTREFIPALCTDNAILMANDPNYSDRIRGLGDDKMVDAYLTGNWDIDEGSAFSDLFDRSTHVLSNVVIPRTWRIDRAHDYGYSAPAATIWTAQSDGTEILINDQYIVLPRNSLIVVSERYFADKEDKGLKLLPQELGKQQHEHEVAKGMYGKVYPGPADSAIFDKDRSHISIHDEYVKCGIRFTKADKRPGSRERRFLMLRQGLKATLDKSPERPHLYFHRSCMNLIAQIPELPLDPENPQDVYTASNDHLYDALGYRLLKVTMTAREAHTIGT